MDKIKNVYYKKPEIIKTFLIILIFLILPFLFFKDSFLINNIFYGQGDALIQNFPIRALIIDIFKNFEFPLWNLYNFSGSPLLADIQAGSLYLVNIVIGLIVPSSLLAFNISTFLHFSLAGIFTFLLVRKYGLSRISSFVSGMVFMFGGFLVIRKSHSQMLYSAIWLPLILFFIEKYRETKKIKYIILSSFAATIQFFAGNTQIFSYSLIIIFFYIIFLFLKKDNGETFRGKIYILNCFWVFLIFILLSLVQLIPSYELLQLSLRENIDYQTFTLFSFHPKNILLFFFPYLFGKVNPDSLKAIGAFYKDNYIESAIFLGILPVVLALTGVFKKNKYKLFWGIILIASFILAFGKYNPIYQLIFKIPLINSFRIPTRHFFEVCFSLAVLSGFGFDYIYKYFKERKFKKNLIFSFTIIIVIFSFFLTIFLYFNNQIQKDFQTFLGYDIEGLSQTFSFLKPTVYLPVCFMILIVLMLITSIYLKKLRPRYQKVFFGFFALIIFLELFSFGHDFEPLNRNEINYLKTKESYSSSIKFLKGDKDIFRIYPVYYENSAKTSPISNLYYNINSFYNIYSISGNNPFMLKDYHYFTYISEEGINPQNEELIKNNNILSALNTKYILLPQQDFDPEKAYEIFEKKLLKLSDSLININSAVADATSFVDFEQNLITIAGNNEDLKIVQFPITLNKSKDYLIKLNISRKIPDLNDIKKSRDNNIHIDFFGENYDSQSQEVVINTDDLNEEFSNFEFRINSSEKVPDKEVCLRIFFWEPGVYVLKDIELREVLEEVSYSDYEKIENYAEPHIYYNKKYLPRFYFVSNIVNVKNLAQAKEVFCDKDFNPSVAAVVENYDNAKTEFKDYQNNGYEVIEYKNNSVLLKIKMEEEGFMVFSDTYYPGWKAYIDDIETDIYKANGILKGILVSQGEHEIKFSFLPKGFLIGGITFGITLIILSILIIFYKK